MTVRSLERMNAQIDRLTALIADLLDVSRAESDRLEHRIADVDLNQVVEEVVDAIQLTTSRHRIVIEGGVALPVAGDRERLGQAFTNLIANAVKYSPNAEQVVVRVADRGGSVTVDVEDFGIGINQDDQTRIFDRFYRVSSPRERTFPGLGIGLYITSQIIHRHGGSIDVTSAEGQGSVFRVTLPVAVPVNRSAETGVGVE
jgi:signal transduction histidine kinase